MSTEPRQPAAPAVLQTELLASIFLRAGDMLGGQPRYECVLARARGAGLRGATVTHGFQGFGSSGVLRAPGLLRRTGAEPVLVEIADRPDRVLAFLPELEQLAGPALVVLKEISVARPAADTPDIAATAGS
jgi:uncharacterized protein